MDQSIGFAYQSKPYSFQSSSYSIFQRNLPIKGNLLQFFEGSLLVQNTWNSFLANQCHFCEICFDLLQKFDSMSALQKKIKLVSAVSKANLPQKSQSTFSSLPNNQDQSFIKLLNIDSSSSLQISHNTLLKSRSTKIPLKNYFRPLISPSQSQLNLTSKNINKNEAIILGSKKRLQVNLNLARLKLTELKLTLDVKRHEKHEILQGKRSRVDQPKQGKMSI